MINWFRVFCLAYFQFIISDIASHKCMGHIHVHEPVEHLVIPCESGNYRTCIVYVYVKYMYMYSYTKVRCN